MSSADPRRSTDNASSPRPSSSSSQYPFPNFSAAQRPGANSQYGGRRGSGASSITSIGGILDPSSQGGHSTIAETNSNAISTLLQPPIVRTGLLPHTAGPSPQKPPSTKDIPPVTLTNIPHVEPAVFQSYLSQAGSLYEAFRRAKESNDEAAVALRRRSRTSSKADAWEGLLGQSQRRHGSVPSTPMLEAPMPVPPSPLDSPQARRRPGSSGSRRGLLPVTPISTIPSVYFEEDFHLENPRTFDIVSERSEIVRQPGANGSAVAPGSGGRKALATNAILQEKLSWYMDTVEVHLISSISTASTSFFAALGSLRQLHTEASESVDKIKALREDLRTLDQDMAVGGLKVVAMRRRRENVGKLGAAVAQLRGVVAAVARCEEKVDKGEIENALQGLDDVESLIVGERVRTGDSDADKSDPGEMLIDLRGIAALEGSTNNLASLRRRIGKGFESRFLEALLGDLRNHVESVPSITTIQRWDKASQRARGIHTRTPSVFPAYMQLDDSLRAALRSHLEGLAKSGGIMSATNAYRESILREVKNLIRKHLPSSNDEDAESTMSASTQGGRHMTQQERSSILARNLRALDAADAEEMLKRIYSNVGEALRRLGTQVKLLLDLTSGIRSPPSTAGLKSPMAEMDSYMGVRSSNPMARSPAPDDNIQQALDMSSILGQAVDAAQTQVTKVLKVRAEQSTRLQLADFLRYFNLNKLFADECEAVSGRGGAALKIVVNAHIKDFVAYYGNRERQALIERMDSDRWDAKDFSESYNTILSQILEASTKDVEAWAKACQLWPLTDHVVNGDLQTNGETVDGPTPTKDKVRSAVIDEQKYILPESAMTVLAGIQGFEELITGVPSMTQEITLSLLDYLKLFNSRSSQLILGAGATRSAGLKNITTKHLALASQALSFVATLIPHIREFVRRRSQGTGNLMTEFDKVKRLYQEHQSGINDKLVDIMSGRATTHVSAMRKINWDGPDSNQAVSPYMETLVKETSTLQKVLSKHLPEMTVRMIMDPVFNSYREQWEKAFAEMEIKTPAGKQRLLRDVEFFRSRISKLEGAAGLGEYLVKLVERKDVGGSFPTPAEKAEADIPTTNGQPGSGDN